jgi:hypothetical protein
MDREELKKIIQNLESRKVRFQVGTSNGELRVFWSGLPPYASRAEESAVEAHVDEVASIMEERSRRP